MMEVLVSLLLNLIVPVISWIINKRAVSEDMHKAYYEFLKQVDKNGLAKVANYMSVERAAEDIENKIKEGRKEAEALTPWMGVARGELGQEEISGSRRHNQRIVDYGQAVDLDVQDDETPWCAIFVNYVLMKAGYEGTREALAKSFLKWGREIDSPTYGCVVVLKRGRSVWQGHVGFFVSETDKGLILLGGNQSNSVSMKEYKLSDVLGYRMPV